MILLPLRLFAIAVPIIAILFDSVPPDVKKISFGSTFNIFAIFSCASLIYFSALTPTICIADGFPKSSVIVFTTMSFTESVTMVVAELSKYASILTSIFNYQLFT